MHLNHESAEARMTPYAIENLRYPTGKTTLMQHLQTLVIRGNNWWVGGVCHPAKFERLAKKFSATYPLHRDERGRSYDRTLGKATVTLVFFPTDQGIAWWLLSSEGKGGLSPNATAPGPDARIAKNARAQDGHITFEDYVLLYAHKKDARTVKDASTGREKQILKDMSTWTWKLNDRVVNEVRALMAREASMLAYGDEPRGDEPAYGLRGLLFYQRQRPLFSAVRTQVLQFHREARELWSPRRKRWLQIHSQLAARFGDRAGELMTMADLTKKHLPKMQRLKVFADEGRTLASLTRPRAPNIDSA